MVAPLFGKLPLETSICTKGLGGIILLCIYQRFLLWFKGRFKESEDVVSSFVIQGRFKESEDVARYQI